MGAKEPNCSFEIGLLSVEDQNRFAFERGAGLFSRERAAPFGLRETGEHVHCIYSITRNVICASTAGSGTDWLVSLLQNLSL